MLTLFLSSLFGHLVVNRLIIRLSQEFALPKDLQRRLCLGFFIWICLQSALFFQNQILHWQFIGILLISLKVFPIFFVYFLEKRFQSSILSLLDQVILEVKGGKSFRFALKSAADYQDGWIRKQVGEIYDCVVDSSKVMTTKSAPIKDLREDFVKIDISSSKCLEHLLALRSHHKMLLDFRRRSGQVSQQIKMQALIVTALYICLLVFVISHFGYQEHQKIIHYSLFLFLLGLILVFLIGRRLKWTV